MDKKERRLKKPPMKRRLLPGDFQKYLSLDDTDKEIQSGKKGFFQFPERMKGNQDIGIKEFLVFYFDEKSDYEVVLDFFQIKKNLKVSHPIVDTKKLVELVKGARK